MDDSKTSMTGTSNHPPSAHGKTAFTPTSVSPTRPTIARLEASISPHANPRAFQQHAPLDHRERGAAERRGGGDGKLGDAGSDAMATGTVTNVTASSSPDEVNATTLQRLKDAVNAKMISNQQSVPIKADGPPRTNSGSIRRISSIKEEAIQGYGGSPKMSPTLTDAFESPLQTGSTESTESVETVKGSAAQTPMVSALRTPSYPFPYVVGTPRGWAHAFHRPFTTLSPTVSASGSKDDTVTDGPSSGLATPVASASMFVPPGFAPSEASQESLYPTPNLYDLTLMINLDPGLPCWWSAVSTIFQDYYGAERLSLALPADAGELENVPWGQKATFNSRGAPTVNQRPQKQSERKESSAQLTRPTHGTLRGGGKMHDIDTELPHPRLSYTSARPSLLSRHSYSGFEAGSRPRSPLPQTPTPTPTTPITADSRASILASSPLPSSRPSAPLRTKSLAPHPLLSSLSESLSEHHEASLSFVSPPTTLPDRFSSLSDTEFSTIPSEQQTGPYSKVLPVLRALNYEAEALLEASSVNRILERGKAVILTRDYTPDASQKATSRVHGSSDTKQDPSRKPKQIHPSLSKEPTKGKKLVSTERDLSRNSSPYEEYEQFPSSPWAQSPAPSPAIQVDTESNPFFAQGAVDEASFVPPENPVDYSYPGAVEAIGVDKANTIFHLPLVHPRSFGKLPFRSGHSAIPGSAAGPEAEGNEGCTSPLKRAPIAIISFAAPVVPYPQQLVQSLQLLAPHLATSFEIAQHYTSATVQNDALQSKRSRAYSTSEKPDALGELADAELDLLNDSNSLTSPSDYSGRSRQSPGGSIGVGTPAWEHNSLVFNQQGVPSTPDRPMSDSYFDAKIRASQATSGTSHPNRVVESPVMENDAPVRSEIRSAFEERPRRLTHRQVQDKRDTKTHTMLHSYGADFRSTFQTLQPAAVPISQARGRFPDAGVVTSSMETNNEMPPPSERLLRTIVDSLPVQIFTATPQTGEISWANSKFLVYRGHSAAFIKQHPWDAIHPEDEGAYLSEWKRSLTTGHQFSHKVRLRRFDNVFRWFYVRATPLKDKHQKIVHWAGTYMDIHEQHVAETNAARQQETAASEAKYRALANSSPQIVFAVTRTRGLTFCNSQWIGYSGQSETEATGVGFMDFVHPEDLAKCQLPTLNEDGSVQVDAPTSLPADSKATAKRHSVEGSEGSSDGSNTITSPGVDSSEPTHMPQSRLYKLASTGILKVSRDQDGRPSYSTEVRLRSKDGQYRWHLVRVLLSEPVRKDGSEEETWYGTCTDINDHKLLEKTLKDTMDAKSRFLSNMSHEIRTPLNGITGMVSFLIDSSLTPEQMEHVNIIRNSTEGLRDLINDILDLSKVEAGMITLTMTWWHARTLIEDVNDIMFSLAIDKGLELNYVIEDNVPSIVRGDRFRIRQVLLNVVGNAIKFTEKGEVFVRCGVVETCEGLGDEEILLKFEVIDTGAGFTEKEAEFLFKRFSQIERSAQTGTGLGLAISMQLVELHGGKMTASSVPGEGSIFTFTAKVAVPSNAERPAMTASSSADSVSGTTSAAVIPTPQPLSETSQGMRFGPGKNPYKFSPSDISPQLLQQSPAASSGSSDPSLYTAGSSIRSQGSSVSSMMTDIVSKTPPIALSLPERTRDIRLSPPPASSPISSSESVKTVTPLQPPSTVSLPNRDTASPQSFLPNIFSIIVLCPMPHAREAIIKHIKLTIPKTAPHNITSRDTVEECNAFLKGEEAIRFSHVVVDLPQVQAILSLLDSVLQSPTHSNTCVVILSDAKQRREIVAAGKQFDFAILDADRRVRFVYKPLKPSKMAIVFDPQKESEVSTDENQNSAQAIAVSQKAVFEELKRRLGNRGLKVLLVEDNKTSQMVLVRFLNRVSIQVECVSDGLKCTEKVFSQPHRTYPLILCDLHMPVKDGYQTCKEIRLWERKNKYPHLPIVALSANVLGDVYSKCVDAGFNSYVTKPVDFREMRDVLMKFLDPPESEHGKEPEFMKMK